MRNNIHMNRSSLARQSLPQETVIVIKSIEISGRKIAVIGLGYVGLPLTIEFAKKRPVMGFYVVSQLVKTMLKKRIHVNGSRILVMGLTFKENCPDTRNSRVFDIINELKSDNAVVDIYDPWLEPCIAEQELGLSILQTPPTHTYDAIIIAVAHRQFKKLTAESIRNYGKEQHILYDLKYVLPKDVSDLRL